MAHLRAYSLHEPGRKTTAANGVIGQAQGNAIGVSGATPGAGEGEINLVDIRVVQYPYWICRRL